MTVILVHSYYPCGHFQGGKNKNININIYIKCLVNNHLDAQFFFCICLFQFSTCFEHPCVHHQENQFYQYGIWHMSL